MLLPPPAALLPTAFPSPFTIDVASLLSILESHGRLPGGPPLPAASDTCLRIRSDGPSGRFLFFVCGPPWLLAALRAAPRLRCKPNAITSMSFRLACSAGALQQQRVDCIVAVTSYRSLV